MKPKNRKLIRDLTRERNKLLASVEVARHENELLALLVEHARQLIQAQAACTIQVGRACGVPEPRGEAVIERRDVWDRQLVKQNGGPK